MSSTSTQGRTPGRRHSPARRHSPDLRRLLVAFGGDGRSRDAVRLGAALARDAGAELHLGLILKTGGASALTYPPVGDISGILADQGRRWLTEAEELVPDEVEVRSHLIADRSVAEGLLGLVESLGADLIVTGSGVGAGRRTLHPVVDALLHSSAVPVALAPRGYFGATPITEILVAFAEDSPVHQVVDRGARWAAQLGVPMAPTTLRTDTDPSVDADPGADPDADDDVVGADEAPALSGAVAEQAAGRCAVLPARVGVGRTVKKAVRGVDWPAGGILLIGSSRLAAGPRTFLGATAARLLAHLPIPLVVMPRNEAAAESEPRP